jgi:prevent-host-death family protein
MEVSVRELKSRLSQILSAARAGEEVTVTSHKRVIARIVGVPGETAEHCDGLTAVQRVALRRMLAEGAASWQGGKPKGGPGHTVIEGRTMADMILEDRRNCAPLN